MPWPKGKRKSKTGGRNAGTPNKWQLPRRALDAQIVKHDQDSFLLVRVNPETGTTVNARFTDKGIKLSLIRKLTIVNAVKSRRRKRKVKHVQRSREV